MKNGTTGQRMASPQLMPKMNNNLKVLKLFIDHKNRTFTIKRAAETLKMNYRIAHEEITKLEKETLIKITRHGNSKVCEFSYKYHSKIVEVEEIRKQSLLNTSKNKDIWLIFKRIKEVKSPFYCLVLFGSHADKTTRKGSDIDLCLITDSPEVNKEVHSILEITPIDVHLQEFSSKQFLSMLKNKEGNVGNEVVKNNVILYGIEAFYELVNNVKR